jgi:hypothetical protein
MALIVYRDEADRGSMLELFRCRLLPNLNVIPFYVGDENQTVFLT